MKMLYEPSRLQAALDTRAATAVVSFTPPNIRYLTQFGKAGGHAAVLANDRPTSPVLVAAAGDLDFVVEDLGESVEVYGYGRFFRHVTDGVDLEAEEQLVRQLHDATRAELGRGATVALALRDRGVTGGRVITDVHPDETDGLLKEMPGVELVQDRSFFRELRRVKTAREIERLAEVARITEVGIAAAFAAAAPGVTQIELARAYRIALAEHDATLRLDNFGIGRSSALGNANLPEDVLQPGSIIRFDGGAIRRGYQSDMSRCAVMLSADERATTAYEAVLAGQQAGLDLIRPGVVASELFAVMVDAVRANGLAHYERTHVGHGIGLSGDGYDPPLLAPGDQTLIEPGMVLCVETPYYELGFAGLQVEDMIEVTDDGYRFLTTSDRNLQLVG